jgi:hypothetical protein
VCGSDGPGQRVFSAVSLVGYGAGVGTYTGHKQLAVEVHFYVVGAVDGLSGLAGDAEGAADVGP